MVDLLKQSLAPINGEAWRQIEEVAARRLKARLTARRHVDVVGPGGWEVAAVNLGRTGEFEPAGHEGQVLWGMRLAQPLVEIRAPFRLRREELDAAARGCQDIDLAPLERAAHAMAEFEDSAIYYGFDAACIQGIASRSPHHAVALHEPVGDYARAIADAGKMLLDAGFKPPLTLILGGGLWANLMQSGSVGYPPQKIIRAMLGGDVVASGVLHGGLLLSAAEGNFELTLGQDLSIGYEGHDAEWVHLFLIESFAFRVLEPAAAVRLEPPE